MINILKINIRLVFPLIIIIFTIVGCTNQDVTPVDTGSIYNYEVLYLFQGDEKLENDKYRFKFSNDSLYIMIESEFKNCQLNILENGKPIFNEIVTTESSTGFANQIVRGNINTINSIEVRVNSGPLIYCEIFNTKNNIIGIRKDNSNIQIVYYKQSPVYY